MSYALILDCDGVIVDAEANIHREAFNQMWREFGVSWEWDPAAYSSALQVAGGRERLRALASNPAFRARCGPLDEGLWDETVDRWHQRKTAIYVEMIKASGIDVRPGVSRLIREARSDGWRTAVVSSGRSAAVLTVLDQTCPGGADLFDVIITSDDLAERKPDPRPYALAVERLGLSPHEAVAIEDSRNGLLSATRAGLACIVCPTAVTGGENFSEADIIVSTLGDQPQFISRVLGGQLRLPEFHQVTPVQLSFMLEARAAANY
jgi:HAD superfamily hydrolase (TIGR01509 family)